MSITEGLLLVLAGLGAGFVGNITGIASIISYPALLAAGLPPVTANVTNTVALVFGGLGAVLGSVPELRGQAARIRRLGAAGVFGGGVGGLLLLLTPAATFRLMVPWLIGLASVAILVPRRGRVLGHRRSGLDAPWLTPGVVLIAVYGGYFGAAAGVLLLAVLLVATGEPLPRCNAMKSAVLGLANGVASLTFVLAGSVRWSAMAPLAAGFLAGGRLGPIVVRRAPTRPLRVVIAMVGAGLAIDLAYQAYR